ncbi:MAG: hypothetical protein JW715_13665 [Sedimentisphaerales bacterium]|nr:hypothetical protein [Sedimentisphaerales bacterium]
MDDIKKQLTSEEHRLAEAQKNKDKAILIGLISAGFEGVFRDQTVEGTAEFTDVWYYNEKKWQLVASQVTPIERL